MVGGMVAACNPEPVSLNVMVHDSFAISTDVVSEFESANKIKVNFILSGDAGSLLNKAVLTKNAPIADILYGVDNTFLSRALSEEILKHMIRHCLNRFPTNLN